MQAYLSRRAFAHLAIGATAAALSSSGCSTRNKPRRLGEAPNIILAMSDDQGWGDTGYNGHPHLRTPYLDEMAHKGLRFDRFYSASPVCSPTRGSCLTGRHPYRYGIFHANSGDGASFYPLPPEELTLAEALKPLGYASGHFGKWHLGDFQGEKKSSPSDNGFDEWFSTVRKTPTYDPKGYWSNGEPVTDILEGDDSTHIVSRALSCIRRKVDERRPFFVALWFHTPHLPIISKGNHRTIYGGHAGESPNYWGAISAMDEQLGRLRRELRRMDVADDTMIWFSSDNGPEGAEQSPEQPGATGGLRGRKRSLFEGGIRVPGLLEWPSRIPEGRATAIPVVSSDIYPTILDALDLTAENQPEPIDGISLLPLIEGDMSERSSNIAFETDRHGERIPKLALIGNRYKLISRLDDSPDLLFDLVDDVKEANNIADEHPEIVAAMRRELEEWRASCDASRKGSDYPAARGKSHAGGVTRRGPMK